MSENAVAQPPVDNQAAAQAAREADKAARDSAVKQADAFFRSEIKDAPKGTPEDLFRKFGAKTAQDSQEQQDRIAEQKDSAKQAQENRPEPETKASLC